MHPNATCPHAHTYTTTTTTICVPEFCSAGFSCWILLTEVYIIFFFYGPFTLPRLTSSFFRALSTGITTWCQPESGPCFCRALKVASLRVYSGAHFKILSRCYRCSKQIYRIFPTSSNIFNKIGSSNVPICLEFSLLFFIPGSLSKVKKNLLWHFLGVARALISM